MARRKFRVTSNIELSRNWRPIILRGADLSDLEVAISNLPSNGRVFIEGYGPLSTNARMSAPRKLSGKGEYRKLHRQSYIDALDWEQIEERMDWFDELWQVIIHYKPPGYTGRRVSVKDLPF